MVTKKRWMEAQAYEKKYWLNLAHQIASGSVSQLEWYRWKANLMEKHLSSHPGYKATTKAKALEIGSGPVGIINYIGWDHRYAIDPLEEFYKTNATLSKIRHSEVIYKSGNGEVLPFDTESCNLVILDNVLDHVHGASQVLNEVNRVLAKDGLFYIAVNIHTPWGGFLHRILSYLKIDRGHPYTFTLNSIRLFLARHRFTIRCEFVNDYLQAKVQDLNSKSLKDKTKGYTGLSEYVYYAVAERQA